MTGIGRRNSWRTVARALVFSLVMAGLLPSSFVQAAPVDQGCRVGSFMQFDIAGTYVSLASQMRVEIYSCGGVLVQWDNAYGTHYAGYYSDMRLPGGGIGAGWLSDSPGKLDMANRVGFKPAEPGYLQVITVSDYGGILGVYRLQKIG